jgi:hypothetical protein
MIPTEMWRVMINGGRIEIQESFESGIRARDARMRNARRNQICVFASPPRAPQETFSLGQPCYSMMTTVGFLEEGKNKDVGSFYN